MNDSIIPNLDKGYDFTSVEDSPLNQARAEALDGTADALKKIIRQHELTEIAGESGLMELSEAISSAEETMFYLATASSSNDDNVREILTCYGLQRLYPNDSSGMD